MLFISLNIKKIKEIKRAILKNKENISHFLLEILLILSADTQPVLSISYGCLVPYELYILVILDNLLDTFFTMLLSNGLS